MSCDKPASRRIFTDDQYFVNALREVIGLDPLYTAEPPTTAERFYRAPPSLPHAQARSHTTGFSVLGSSSRDDERMDESSEYEDGKKPLRFEQPQSQLRARANRRWDRVRRERAERT